MSSEVNNEYGKLPLDFVRRLRNEEALSIGVNLRTPRVDGDFAVSPFFAFDLDG